MGYSPDLSLLATQPGNPRVKQAPPAAGWLPGALSVPGVPSTGRPMREVALP